jgi:hypothetical protein
MRGVGCLLFALLSQRLFGGAIGQLSSSNTKIFPEPAQLIVSSSLQSCCRYIHSSLDLISCVNNSLSQDDLPNIPRLIPYRDSKQGPKLFVTLLTRATAPIFDYAAYSYFLQAIYANHNGYLLLPLFPDTNTQDYSLYRKLAPLQEALSGVSADCDYIVWMDAGSASASVISHPLCFSPSLSFSLSVSRSISRILRLSLKISPSWISE